MFLCLFKRSIALGLGVGLGLGIGLGFVLGLGLGVGLALGLGWVRHYMLRSESARIKPSFSRRIPKKNKRRQKILENFRNFSSSFSSLYAPPQDPNLSFKAQIPALRLKYQPIASKVTKHKYCPSHHHTSTYTHIGASGTADHLTLLQLFDIRQSLLVSP